MQIGDVLRALVGGTSVLGVPEGTCWRYLGPGGRAIVGGTLIIDHSDLGACWSWTCVLELPLEPLGLVHLWHALEVANLGQVVRLDHDAVGLGLAGRHLGEARKLAEVVGLGKLEPNVT